MRTLAATGLAAVTALVLVAGVTGLAAPHHHRAASSITPPAEGAHIGRFPDFGQLIPPGEFQGRTFKLSQDYPTTRPTIEPAVKRILAIDYTKNWKAYAGAVFDYVLAGNVENRAPADAFYLEDNPVRRWYHVPWQHWGDSGREGIHGLTAEGPIYPLVLGPAQKGPELGQSYAVGFYNAPGGYLIGKVWADANNPDLDAVRREGGFPVGTVVAKILFTTVSVNEAPFLTNPIEWTAFIKQRYTSPTASGFPIQPRHLDTVRLIQMDIMVRDDRAKATGGWVYGTYVYNGAKSQIGQWRNLVPMGLLWGNDPTVTSHAEGNPHPTDKTLTNPDLKHTVINTDDKYLPPSHLGFGLRLSGPIDNTMSSCKSCHSAAQFPMMSPILPFLAQKKGCPLRPTDAEWWRWFRDLGPTDAFDTGGHPMDNSLQLAGSVQNFLAARTQQTGGLYKQQYWKGLPITRVFNERGAAPPQSETCKSS
ncbi:MAG: hypothetical protein ABI376_06495 [Caulobacteraceae bacterium]